MYKWLRFRNDVFTLYAGPENNARSFRDKTNQMHPLLKFKYDTSDNSGIFLHRTNASKLQIYLTSKHLSKRVKNPLHSKGIITP